MSYSSKNAEINSKNINLKFKKGKFKAKRTSENPGTITFTYSNLKPDQVGYIRFSKNLMEQIVVLNSYQMKQKPDYRLPLLSQLMEKMFIFNNTQINLLEFKLIKTENW